ncbi:hypothetical protein C8R45DRAFT_976358 [Mycena sanguinolenta]|nr:hypothetical protein C8R45DRAFT_976358 [Mycena sanguinolenta]
MACQTFVRNHIVSTITADTYRVQPFNLSEQGWDSISDDSEDSAQENRRMEWLGDDIIAGRISLKIYEMFSDGNVELYHTMRESLVCNFTFKHLMQKIGVAAAISCPWNKTSADVFETLVGALYNEHAKSHLEDKFYAWFDAIFMPLIEAGYIAYQAFKRHLNFNTKTRAARFKSRKRLGHKAVLKALRSSRYPFRAAEKHRKRYLTRNILPTPCVASSYHTTFPPIIHPEPLFGLDSQTFNGDDEDLGEYIEEHLDGSDDDGGQLNAYEDKERLGAPDDEEGNLDAYEEDEDLGAPEDDDGYLDPFEDNEVDAFTGYGDLDTSEDNQENLEDLDGYESQDNEVFNGYDHSENDNEDLNASDDGRYYHTSKLVVPPPVTFWSKFELAWRSRAFSTASTTTY